MISVYMVPSIVLAHRTPPSCLFRVVNILSTDTNSSPGNLRKRFVKKNGTAAVVRKRSRTKDAETRRGQAILHLVKSNNFIRFRPLLRSQPHLQRYKLFWVCDKTDLTQKMARNIIEDTQPGLTPNPAWNSKTMAFAVASKILATAHTQRAQFSACESTLMEAINLLRTGDNTCRIRAIGLCLTLSSWKRRWGDIKASLDIDALILQIEGGITGMEMCQDCKPNLKCEACSRNRSNCPGCQSTTRKMCRTCEGAGQRRRNTIKARQELVEFSMVSTSVVGTIT
jgi:hypothetical protein